MKYRSDETMSHKLFFIQHNNDTGPNDDYYIEWYEVVSQRTRDVICKCETEDYANIMATALTDLIIKVGGVL